MTLPNFLGIGAARSGTSWLDRILRSHPDIYLPERRKEVDFFNRYYDRGIEWYQEFFPSSDRALKYCNIGEVSPGYLYCEDVPLRIQKHLPNCRFILILRNPADRAYSTYGFLIRERNEKRTFRQLCDQAPSVFMKGLYYKQLQQYLRYFPLEKFLILIYEHTMNKPEQSLIKLANFLSVDASKFNRQLFEQRVNASRLVRFPRARLLARRFRTFLRQNDLDGVWNFVKASGAEQIFEKPGNIPQIAPDVRAEMISKYESDIAALEQLIGIDLSVWRRPLS